MLVELEIRGFALVDHLVLELSEGLSVLTGETGAGKSIVLDSLSFLLGESPRGASDKQSCRVAGRFLPSETVIGYLEEQGLPAQTEELLISRERKPGGRTSSRLNGSLVTTTQLKTLSKLLVDLHGQHQSYGLTKASSHLPMLDQVAGPSQVEELEVYQKLYQELSELKSEIANSQAEEREVLREIEWLRLEIEEIADAQPQVDEDDSLELEIKRMAFSEQLSKGVDEALAQLNGNTGVQDRLASVLSKLEPLGNLDDALRGLADRLMVAEIEIREAARDLSSYRGTISHDALALDRLLQRAELLKRLRRKFGPRLEDVLLHQQKATEKLDRLENRDHYLQDLETKAKQLGDRLENHAKSLSKRRKKAARALETRLVEELGQLAMPAVVFRVSLSRRSSLGPTGNEDCEFLFSPNPGHPPSPIAETASGGELSRVMLALVSILSSFQKQPTLIFDEIDVGLGGRTAEAVAARLSELAQRAQVLCVTHLPVVAAAGSCHFVVEKSSSVDETLISVKKLGPKQRVEEIARMLSGNQSKSRARQLATDLLAVGSPQ